MGYTAILQVTGTRLDKFATFETEAEAASHIAALGHISPGAYPDAYVVETLATPPHTWVCDAVAQTATLAPDPTDAERAAGLSLRRADFFVALDAALGLTTDDPLVEDYVKSVISSATSMTAAEIRLACTLLGGAADFYRIDPDIGEALLISVAVELGLGAPESGWTTETTEERRSAAAAALDVLFIAAVGAS